MAMAGLGDPATIWSRPFHYFIALRNEYLEILRPAKKDDEDEVQVRQVAPGITVETRKRKDD